MNAAKLARGFVRAETAFALLSLLGVLVASYEITEVPLHVDAGTYLMQGGFFALDTERGLLEGVLVDFSRLIKNILFCDRSDSYVPLYAFWAKGVLRATDSYLLAAHLPQVIWQGLMPGLLALWLHRGPLRLGLMGSFLAGWSVLWSSYFLAISRMGWLQPSVLSLMLLHLFAVNALFPRGAEFRPGERTLSPWVLFLGMATALAMVLQHGTSVYLCVAVLLFLVIRESRERPLGVPVSSLRYVLMILPAVLALYHLYQCTYPEESPFKETPLPRLWNAMLDYNGGSPFTALGWELLLPGCAGLVLSITRDRKFLVPFYYLAVYMVCSLIFSPWPHYRYWAPWLPVLAISTGYAFQLGWRRLPRWASVAALVVLVIVPPLRMHQSLFATKPSFLTNPLAWKFHDGGRGLRSFERMLQALEVLAETEGAEPIYVLHNYAGLLYTREVGLEAKHVVETTLLRKRPRAFIATTWAWSDSKRTIRFLSDYEKMFNDGAGLTLFMAR